MAEKKRTSKKKTEDRKTSPTYKQLFRSKSDKMIAGICGGLAEYTGIDPSLIRIVFVLSCLISGAGFIAYLIGWFIIPVKDETGEPSLTPASTVIGSIIGMLFILGGLSVLLSNRFWMPHWFDIVSFGRLLLSLALIGVGSVVLTKFVRKKDETKIGEKTEGPEKTILYRSTTNRKLKGICGGIGEYFSIDPTIVRILWVVGTIITHIIPGIVIYIVMAYIVPEAPESA